jgi:NAD(P)-dependent dehydrogenase (short-subunit alcohol dehydrogenase family)
MHLKGKVALITGGATGIGRAAAIAFSREGAKVIVADVNEVEGKKTVQAIEREALFLPADVSSPTDVARLVKEVEKRYGGLDVLLCCAGILLSPGVMIDELADATWEKVIDVNLRGTFLCAKYAFPLMKRKGRGVIILIASGAGVKGPSSSLAYGASKGGVQGLAFTLQRQLEPLGIRVNVVCPGGIATPLKLRLVDELADKEGRSAEEVSLEKSLLGEPEGVAKVLAFLASDEADYVRGTIFTR